MRLGPLFDRFWRRAPAREARNEQKKAAAALINALAITMIATGLVGPAINPVLAESLALWHRVVLACGGLVAHIVVRGVLWSLEDR